MTKVGKRLSAAGIALLLAGPVSQAIGAEFRPDPLLSIDQNRPVVIERIVEVFRPAFGVGQEATVRQALAGMRADHLLAASLAPSLDGLLAVLKSAEASSSVVLAKPVGKVLGDIGKDLVYTPVTPCRLFDTRDSQGGLGTPTPGVRRTYGAITPVASQGGPGGCAAASGAAVALIQIGTLTPSGNGLLQGGPQGAASFPNALILYQPGDQYGTAVAMPLNPANGQFDLVEQFATADLYGDLLGYFRAPSGGFVTGSCGPGKAIRKVNDDGTVVCEATAGSALYQPPMKPWVLDLAGLGSGYCCYAGGFTDGPNAYLVPLTDGAGTMMGRVVRVNIDKFALTDIASVDVAGVDPSARGFYGGFTDGRYGYLSPYQNTSGGTKHGRIARIDLQNFTPAGVTILNLQSVDAELAGFRGGFTDGRYGYFVPLQNNTTSFGKLVRVDLANFTTGGVTVLNLATFDPDLVYFTSGFTDGKYAYLVTRNYLHNKIARVDLANFTTGGITVLNLTAVDPAFGASGGTFTDGNFGYFTTLDSAPSVYSGKIARVNLSSFTVSGVVVLDLAAVDAGLKGFQGGFTDGRYAWIPPAVGSKGARIDLANFSTSGVSVIDFASFDPSATTFASSFTNGRHGVMVPYGGTKLMRVQMFQGPGSL
jgi:hypothetical protein